MDKAGGVRKRNSTKSVWISLSRVRSAFAGTINERLKGTRNPNTSLQLMTRNFLLVHWNLEVETIVGNQHLERRANFALLPSALIYFSRPPMRGVHTSLASWTSFLNLCKKSIKRLLDDYGKELTKFVSEPAPPLRCSWNCTVWLRTYIFSLVITSVQRVHPPKPISEQIRPACCKSRQCLASRSRTRFAYELARLVFHWPLPVRLVSFGVLRPFLIGRKDGWKVRVNTKYLKSHSPLRWDVYVATSEPATINPII